jgi:hypothetical protein
VCCQQTTPKAISKVQVLESKDVAGTGAF